MQKSATLGLEEYSSLDPRTGMEASSNTILPRVNVSPSKHKTVIALHWLPVILTGCILPIPGFLLMHELTDLHDSINMLPWLILFGLSSIFSLVRRTWKLIKVDSVVRPIGGTRWSLDYFGWNFFIIFIILTALISLGSALGLVRVAAMGDALLVLVVSVQLIWTWLGRCLHLKAPFALSSTKRGSPMRSGCFVIAEDIVAVEANGGTELRRQLCARYDASRLIQVVCSKLDALWGFTGLVMSICVLVLIFVIPGRNGELYAWAIGTFICYSPVQNLSDRRCRIRCSLDLGRNIGVYNCSHGQWSSGS